MNRAVCTTAAALICIGRVIRMTRTAMNVVKGVGAAVAIGAAVGLAGGYIATSRRSPMKKGVRKAARRMEHLMDGMTHMFG